MEHLKNQLFRIVLLLSAEILLVLFMFSLGIPITTYEITGDSMEPTFYDEDTVNVVEKEFYDTGDVVIFTPTTNKGIGVCVKRVFAVSGDIVSILDKGLSLNGVIYGKYLNQGNKEVYYGDKVFVLDDEEYFLVGDNFNNSIDSRSFGIVHKKDILGSIKE